MDKKDLLKRLKKMLDKDRFEHSLRVEKSALELAKHYKENPEKASIAALLHDCGRYVPPSEMAKEAKKFGINLSSLEISQPKLIHAKLGAKVAKKIFKIKDRLILSAIKKHTTGSPKMALLEKIIYLADHIEHGRRFKEVSTLRKLAYKNMDKAIVASTTSMLKSLISKGLLICRETIETRNYYIKQGKNAR